jgi:hypothetical protein
MVVMAWGMCFTDRPVGAGSLRGDRVDFDPRVRLEFRGTQLSSDGGLLVMRELDDALGLSGLASASLCDNRPGKNTVHRLDGLFRQSVYARLAVCEDVNDAERLALDPVIRQVVDGRAVDAQAASASQMGRFETDMLALAENRAALADLNGQWIDRFHDRNDLTYIVLDMDSSVSPTHGDQEGAEWNVMGWLPPCLNGIAMCQGGDVTATETGKDGNMGRRKGPKWQVLPRLIHRNLTVAVSCA